MLKLRAGIAAAAVALAGSLGASTATAATTVGQTLDPTGSGCTNGYQALQTTAPDDRYIVPAAGILTSWSFQGGTGTNATLKFKVARPTGNPNEFLMVGESAVKAPVAGPNTYTEISIPVQAGDVIGFYTVSGGDCSANTPSVSGYEAKWRFEGSDTAAPGTTGTYPNNSAYQMNVAASLEADCDSDGLGDETEDPDTASCPQPDADGDGVPDTIDQCPSVPGPASNNGCPLASPLPDTSPPQTTITKAPPADARKSKAKFKFASSEAGSTFQCALKGKGAAAQLKQFSTCSSPRKYGGLDPGKYVFRVRALDAAGNVDPTAAKAKFGLTD